ncbi:MAG TPA: carboxypeptidase-like regulatory domain-containing protein [Acidobacteriaceae bacterium]|nr:carboxypeptidase-like regulatory domain-containing protein [Acidobacteriaceae bacterium]
MTHQSHALRVSPSAFTFSLISKTLGLVCALLLLACGAQSVSAQTAGAGTITGTITDTSHAVITSATVTITNLDTGVSANIPVNADGLYVAPFLKPGHYTVRITPEASRRWKSQPSTLASARPSRWTLRCRPPASPPKW